jgi:hypothetical protein
MPCVVWCERPAFFELLNFFVGPRPNFCDLRPSIFLADECGHAQVLIGHGVVYHLEFSEQPGFKIGRDAAGMGIVHEESPQPAIP